MKTCDLYQDQLAPGSVALVGVPWDEKSSHLRGAAEAPTAIRQFMHADVANFSAESLRNLWFDDQFVDAGDVKVRPGEQAMGDITSGIARIVEQRAFPLSIGGDHAVAYPIVRAVAEHHHDLTILQIDAHPDLYEEIDGDRYSHGCPFARIMEDGLAKRLVQVGIRAITPHQQEQADRFGVEVIDMRAWAGELTTALDGPLYISLDLDGIDPGEAPAVAHPEPGGLRAREVISMLQQIPVPIVGADVVEFIPQRDLNDITASLCWKFIKELTDGILRSS